MKTTLFIVACLFLPLSATEHRTPVVVSLRDGQIRGEYVQVKGSENRAKQFLAIPFARPPVGPLRLAAPQAVEPWDGERDGTQQPPMCIQDPDVLVNVSRTMSLQYTPPEVSEDCLYLNVYAPAEAQSGDKLPVMVWIHGGGLSVGAASQYDGSALAAYENMVTVIIQYRLGILGFLSTGDKHAKGNWGLLDQLAALKWVQENIDVFGGDAQRVTVAGESAGAISASILTLSPLANGLFHRAIFQSGVATVGAYTTNKPLGEAKIVANLTGCEYSNTGELVECVKGQSRDQLITVAKKMKIFLGAVVDGEFLTDVAEALFQKKEVLKVPVMMGITNHEFGWILPQSFGTPGWEHGMNRESVMAIMNMFNPPGASLVNGLIADEYLKNASSPEDIRDAFTEIMGDLLMTLPVMKVVGHLTDAGVPVYLYEFVYRADIHKQTRPSFVRADHADDVGFMLGGCFWDGPLKIIGNITKEDESVCRNMMAYWASFVRNGSPDTPARVCWPQYDQQNKAYMELGLSQTVKHNLKEDSVRFATVTLPQRLRTLMAAAPGN